MALGKDFTNAFFVIETEIYYLDHRSAVLLLILTIKYPLGFWVVKGGKVENFYNGKKKRSWSEVKINLGF